MKSILLTTIAMCLLFVSSDAQARHARHHYHTSHYRHSSHIQTAHGGGLTRICEGGSCGTVAARAAEKFSGLFRDLRAMGYDLGSPGCYSPHGHMRNSLHHSGNACDLFNQYARNRTHLRMPPASVQIEVAARHGLTAGASWCNPDGGHFDLSGYNGCRGRSYTAHTYASYHPRHHRHYRRYASR